MKNQRGITLITLITTIIILLILASITVYNTVEMYRTMNYENFKVQLEEVQTAVDKMCEKYKTGDYNSYIDSENGFFIKNYNKIPGNLTSAENKQNAETIIRKYFGGKSDFHEGFVFYFSADEIKEFFNINGIEFDVIVDFSTRYVYSVEGCNDPDNDEMIYSLLDIDSSMVVQKNDAKTASSSSGIVFTQKNLQSGDTNMCAITLVLNYEGNGNRYDIKKAYYSNNGGENWVDVDYLGDCKYTQDTVSFYIYNPGTYFFKIEDTSGKIITNVQGTSDSVHTTINF